MHSSQILGVNILKNFLMVLFITSRFVFNRYLKLPVNGVVWNTCVNSVMFKSEYNSTLKILIFSLRFSNYTLGNLSYFLLSPTLFSSLQDTYNNLNIDQYINISHMNASYVLPVLLHILNSPSIMISTSICIVAHIAGFYSFFVIE